MANSIYKGFSSYQYEYNKSLKLLDVEVVKRDLLNHIFTRLGERVHMPTFGTRIPDLLFEPLDDTTIDVVENDLNNVFEFDPRVKLIELVMTPVYEENSLTCSALLNYIELDLQDVLDIRLVFDR